MKNWTPDELEMLDKAREGDADALEKLLRRHEPQIYKFGIRMCRNPEDAEDIMQDTMLAIARTVRRFQGRSSLSTWLFKIARSFCIKKRRKGKFEPEEEHVVDSQIPDHRRDPEEILAAKEIEDVFTQAIRELDPKYREVFLLRDVEGLSAPEVSQIVGIPVDTVKTRLHRARAAVRDKVAPLLGTGN